MASKVYYMDGRSTSPQTSMVNKMLTVYEEAGFDNLIKRGDVVAIKVHCGEWDNTAYLRPVYARAVADRVKELGGRPFVCDTTTLPYSPTNSRCTGLDLMVTAERNGNTSAAFGCPFICADGFMGTDDYRVDIPEGFILKEAYIAQAIAAADVLITLTHFKGHFVGVFGGSIKNLGIGAQSKRGKFNVHMGGHPKYGYAASTLFHPENCKGRKGDPDWQLLEDICPFGLFHVTENSIEWKREKCVDCLSCLGPMSGRGIFEISNENFKATNAAIADACLATTKAVGKDKVAYINMALDLTPRCDCAGFSDAPIVPNLGVFASSDPVAVDKACLDKSKEAAGIPGTVADDMGVIEPGVHKFDICSPLLSGLSEDIQVNTGEVIGLGTRNYELVEVDEKPMSKFIFPPDPRVAGLRMRPKFKKIQVFPYDRYEGKGFLREEEVNLDYVNAYYENDKMLEKP
jgi:uncharacterized Fe-S center protein